MLLSLTLLAAAAPSPAPTAPVGGESAQSFLDLIPLVTGASGALVVLLVILYLFATDKITTTGAVERLREADNNRFNDMMEQRDALVAGLERSNQTAATAQDNQQQTLALLHELVDATQGVKAPPRRRT